MRLLGIYRLFFFVFAKPGKVWSDQVMIIITFIPVSVTIVVLILWSVLDPVPTAIPVPLSEQSNVFPHVTTACGGSYDIWASV